MVPQLAKMYSNITKQTLETIYDKVISNVNFLQYWKNEREIRKRSFLRVFWEKADFDDTDAHAAFRKR